MKATGNTVLLTGGSAGIGLALAKHFLAQGNRVIITGRQPARLQSLRQELPGLLTEVCDLNNLALLAKLVAKYPEINILVNNAGVQQNYAFTDSTIAPEVIEAEICTNLTAPLTLTKLCLPYLLANQPAAVINVSSGLGLVPKQSAPVYCATKAAVHSFSKSLRWQLQDSGVKVFEIIPPLVDTVMTAGRGKNKIAPEELVAEFWQSFLRDKYEVRVGRTKILAALNRFAPTLAERIMRHA